jgi:hypothetical protein
LPSSESWIVNKAIFIDLTLRLFAGKNISVLALVDSYCLKVEKYLTKPLEVWRFVSNGL